VERWAELRREHFVRAVPIKELARRYGIDRNTVRRALRSDRPPRYERAHVQASTGLCDAPPVDAELADAAVINRLDGYLGDFEAWRAEIEAGRDGEIERIRGEVERAEAALKTSEAAVSAIAADYERRLVGGDQAGADEAMRLLTQKREETERAQVRLEATRDAFATEEAREVSADARIVPPLRPIEAEFANSQAPTHVRSPAAASRSARFITVRGAKACLGFFPGGSTG
jgi:hypothetical protein